MDSSEYCRALSRKNDAHIMVILCEGEKRQVESRRKDIAILLDRFYYDILESRKFIDSQQEDAVLKLYFCATPKDTQIATTIRRDDYFAVSELIKRDISTGDPERLEKYFIAMSNESSEEHRLYEDYCPTIRDALTSLQCEPSPSAGLCTGTIPAEQTDLNLLALVYEDEIRFREVMQKDVYQQRIKQLFELDAYNGLLSYFDDELLSSYRNSNGEPLKGAIRETKNTCWRIIPGKYANPAAKRKFVKYVLLPRAKEILS